MHENPDEGHENLMYREHSTVLNSFQQLSKCSDPRKSTNPFMTLGIRSGVQATDGSPSDAPGLLFYYLFDDWYAAYSLVIRDENQYARNLEKLVSSGLTSFLLGC